MKTVRGYIEAACQAQRACGYTVRDLQVARDEPAREIGNFELEDAGMAKK